MGSHRNALRCGEPELELLGGKITGTGAADPTDNEGNNGYRVTRTGTGIYTVTFDGPVQQCWPSEPGKWAVTGTDIDRWSVVFGQYDAATRTVIFTVYTDAGAPANLAALTGLNLLFLVKLSSARG